MTEQEQQTVNAYTRTQAPVCIGRFQVAMPQQLTLGYSTITVNDARISAKFTSRQMFQRFIRERREELANTATNDERDQPYLKKVHNIDPDTVIFDRNEAPHMPDAARVLEGYRWAGLTLFMVEIKATDVADDRYTDMRASLATNKPDRLKQVEYLLQNLHPRKAHEIPDTPGLCFEGGFLAGGADEPIPGAALPFREETVAMTFIDKAHRDVYLHLLVDSTISTETTLLDRSGDAESVLQSDNQFSILRKGDVSLQGVEQAEEWLGTLTTRQNVTGNQFLLEANSQQGSAQKPLISMKLMNGEFSLVRNNHPTLDGASLTDAEAAGLWDAITRSFQARANAF